MGEWDDRKSKYFLTLHSKASYLREFKWKTITHSHTECGQGEWVVDGVREVVLTVTVTVKVKEKTAFLVEVKQAGIFSLNRFLDH